MTMDDEVDAPRPKRAKVSTLLTMESMLSSINVNNTSMTTVTTVPTGGENENFCDAHCLHGISQALETLEARTAGGIIVTCADGVDVCASQALVHDAGCLEAWRELCEDHVPGHDDAKFAAQTKLPLDVDSSSLMVFMFILDNVPKGIGACSSYKLLARCCKAVREVLGMMTLPQRLQLHADAKYLNCDVVSLVLQAHIAFYDIDLMAPKQVAELFKDMRNVAASALLPPAPLRQWLASLYGASNN